MKRRIGMVVVVVAAILLGWIALGLFRPAVTPAAPETISWSTPTVDPQLSASPDSPSEGHTPEGQLEEGVDGDGSDIAPTPDHEGTELENYDMPQEDQTAAVETSAEFIAGWLLVDPEQRTAALSGLAAPALVTALSDPRTRVWNVAPQGEPVLLHTTSTAASTRQKFTDGRSVDLFLIYDPTTDPVWSVVDVQPTKES